MQRWQILLFGTLVLVIGAIQFLWNATRGSRLRPWRSPFLRWRVETYSGMHADQIGAREMLRFLWQEKWQFLRFLKWTDDIREQSRSGSGNHHA